MDINVIVEDETTGEPHEIELPNDVDVSTLITAILGKIHPEVINASGWNLTNLDRNQTYKLNDTLEGTKLGSRLLLSKTYSPMEDGVLVGESGITTFEDCASVSCENSEFEKDEIIIRCSVCNQLLIRCSTCNTLNRVYAKFCRSCKNPITERKEVVKVFYDNLKMPLAQKFPAFSHSFVMQDALNTPPILTPIYGNLLVTTPSGVGLINTQAGNPATTSSRRNFFSDLSSAIPLESGESIRGKPCVTDDAVYFTTDKSIFKAELKDFDKPDNIEFEKVITSDDGILEMLPLPANQMAVLTKSAVQIYDSDFQIVAQQDEKQEAPNTLLPYDESEFIGIGSLSTCFYKLDDGQLQRASCNAEDNAEKTQFVSLEKSIFSLKNGELYSDIPTTRRDDMSIQQILTPTNRNYQKLYPYSRGSVRGIIAEYENGWDFYSPYPPYQRDERKSRDGITLDLSVPSEMFGKFYLCGVRDAESFELKVAIFDIEQRLRLRYSTESYREIYDMSVSFDNVYVLTRQRDRMELVGYALKE